MPVPTGKSTTKPTYTAADSWRGELIVFFAAFSVIGPLALPLLWLNPRYRFWFKFWLSTAAILFTIGLTLWAWWLYRELLARLGAADGTALWEILRVLAEQHGH